MQNLDNRKLSHVLCPNEKIIDNYVYNYKSDKIGRGAYGTVFKGRNVQNGEEVAIKIVKKKDLVDRDDELQLVQEISIMEQMKSPNIVKMIDVLQTENNYYIIMEYCSMGDLDHVLFKKGSMGPQEHYKFLIDILTAFQTLISCEIIHRDLKPANILVTKSKKESKIFKLADFGFARKVKNFKRVMLDSKVGTPLYMSPQLLDNQIYSSKSDIWSLAYILYQIIYLKTPWSGRSEVELLFHIKNMPLVFPEKPEIPNAAKDFIQGCLQIQEKDRFSWDQIYNHPYVVDHFKAYIDQNRLVETKVNYLLQSLRQKAKMSNLQKLFLDLDKSGDHALNIEEFTELMHKIDSDLNAKEIQLVFDEIDTDGNGDIDFFEFKKALQLNEEKVRKVKQAYINQRVQNTLIKLDNAIKKYNMNLYQLFSKYDTSGNGSLDREELSQILIKIDPTMTPADLEDSLNLFDENGDGEIQFNEFKNVFDELQIEQSLIQSAKMTNSMNNKLTQSQRLVQIQKKSNIPDSDEEDFEVKSINSSIQMKKPSQTSTSNLIQKQGGIHIIPMMLPKNRKNPQQQ